MNISGLNTAMGHIKKCHESGEFEVRFWSSMNEYPIMYSLVHIYGIDNIVECGTNVGCSALLYATALMKKNKGKVYTWDVRPLKGVDGGTNLEDRIIRHLTPYTAGGHVIENIPGKRLFFIDGDHSESACLEDFLFTKKYTRSGDVIVFHDYVKFPTVATAIHKGLGNFPRIKKDYLIGSSCGLYVVEL